MRYNYFYSTWCKKRQELPCAATARRPSVCDAAGVGEVGVAVGLPRLLGPVGKGAAGGVVGVAVIGALEGDGEEGAEEDAVDHPEDPDRLVVDLAVLAGDHREEDEEQEEVHPEADDADAGVIGRDERGGGETSDHAGDVVVEELDGRAALERRLLEVERPEPELIAGCEQHDGEGQIHQAGDGVEVEEPGLAMLRVILPCGVEHVGALEARGEQSDEDEAAPSELVGKADVESRVGVLDMPEANAMVMTKEGSKNEVEAACHGYTERS